MCLLGLAVAKDQPRLDRIAQNARALLALAVAALLRLNALAAQALLNAAEHLEQKIKPASQEHRPELRRAPPRKEIHLSIPSVRCRSLAGSDLRPARVKLLADRQ